MKLPVIKLITLHENICISRSVILVPKAAPEVWGENCELNSNNNISFQHTFTYIIDSVDRSPPYVSFRKKGERCRNTIFVRYTGVKSHNVNGHQENIRGIGPISRTLRIESYVPLIYEGMDGMDGWRKWSIISDRPFVAEPQVETTGRPRTPGLWTLGRR